MSYIKTREVISMNKEKDCDFMEWIICPICGRKTHNKIREDTVLKNYPLYCPKCRQETFISTKDLQITVIQNQEH